MRFVLPARPCHLLVGLAVLAAMATAADNYTVSATLTGSGSDQAYGAYNTASVSGNGLLFAVGEPCECHRMNRRVDRRTKGQMQWSTVESDNSVAYGICSPSLF